ncbi:DUF1396 domain-containing protein [Streptomyces sp. NPDC052077]|uniref:DUF1396 domain-containing protein n=1 Tax=Streptomyces sp. NPDC052077 TaxID=3154757 RepID=UPI00341B4B20
MNQSIRKPVVAGVAALLLAAGAVGCGAEKEKSPEMSPAAAVAKAAKNSRDITTLSYRMTGRTPEEGRVEADVQMRIKPTVAMSMKIKALDQGADGTAEIRVVDGAMFMGGNPEMSKEMDGRDWIKFDLSALGVDKEQMNALGGASSAESNPAEESTFLTGADDLEKVGTEKIGGVETTHYKGIVSLAAMRKSYEKEDDAKAREKSLKSLEKYEQMGIDKLLMDMWMDGDHQTKQFRVRGDAEKGKLDVTIAFKDVNKPVKVTAPHPSQVMDLSEMMKEGAEGAEG